MLKAKHNRIKPCQHCTKEFPQVKSNQKFCSTSCRASNWAMNKGKVTTTSAVSKRTQNETEVSPSLTNNDVIKTGGAALVANTIVEATKSLRGINNSDLSRKLDLILASNERILVNQKVMAQNQQVILNHISKPKNPWS